MKRQLLQLVVVFFPTVEVEKACPNFSMSQTTIHGTHSCHNSQVPKVMLASVDF